MKHQDWLAGLVKDEDFAAQYLAQAVQDLEPTVFTATAPCNRQTRVVDWLNQR
jgi:hypothetical protein